MLNSGQKGQKRAHGWREDLEGEVGHYFENEPGAHSQNLDPDVIGVGAEPKPPRFPPGADYWVMMTVAERLLEADQVMPFRGRRYATERTVGEPGALPRQSMVADARPSCSMVLRAAYGTMACKYDDSAPNGEKLLRQAQEAYTVAAGRVPARQRPPGKAADRVRAKLERALRRMDRELGL